MTDLEKRKGLKDKCYIVIKLTIEEAKKLNGMLAMIVPLQLKEYGFYVCKDNVGMRYYEKV